MTWDDFYDRYDTWAEATVRSRISSLENVGAGEEVVDAIQALDNEALKGQLVRKAMRLGVSFTHDDFMNLEGEVSDALYEEISRYGGFYLDNPYFDPDDFTWDDFYGECSALPDELLRSCIPKIRAFGPSDEVAEAVMQIMDSELSDQLYERAVAHGVCFTKQQLEDMGQEDDGYLFLADEVRGFGNMSDENIAHFSETVRIVTENIERRATQTQKPKPTKMTKKKTRTGLLGLLVALGSSSRKKKSAKKASTGKCDGNCAKCPAHYGYRYGRWYYGHAHQYGCERGGNGGRTGKCYRD